MILIPLEHEQVLAEVLLYAVHTCGGAGAFARTSAGGNRGQLSVDACAKDSVSTNAPYEALQPPPRVVEPSPRSPLPSPVQRAAHHRSRHPHHHHHHPHHLLLGLSTPPRCHCLLVLRLRRGRCAPHGAEQNVPPLSWPTRRCGLTWTAATTLDGLVSTWRSALTQSGMPKGS
jgi:hypothetical protein